MVHDLTDPSSLASIDHTWMGEVGAFSSATKSPSLVVVGNKADLKVNPNEAHHLRDPNLGLAAGAGQGDAHFDIDDSRIAGLPRFEVSAKSGQGVEDGELMSTIHHTHPPYTTPAHPHAPPPPPTTHHHHRPPTTTDPALQSSCTSRTT